MEGCQHARVNGGPHCLRDGDFKELQEAQEELQGELDRNDREHLSFAATLSRIESNLTQKIDQMKLAIGEPPNPVQDFHGTGINGKLSMILNAMIRSGMTHRESFDTESEITGMMDRDALITRAHTAEAERQAREASENEMARKYRIALIGAIAGGVVSVIGAVAALLQAMQ